MEKEKRNDNSRIVLAFIFIGIGIIWILRQLGFYFNLLHINWSLIFEPFWLVTSRISQFIFSWQMILIIIGLILLAGKRSAGIVFILVGGIFMLPKIFFFPWLSMSMLLPLVLIGIGIAIVVRRV